MAVSWRDYNYRVLVRQSFIHVSLAYGDKIPWSFLFFISSQPGYNVTNVRAIQSEQ